MRATVVLLGDSAEGAPMLGGKWQRKRCDARQTLVRSDMPTVGPVFHQQLVKHIKIGYDKTRQQILSRLITDIGRLLIVGLYIAVALVCVCRRY